MNHKPLSLLTLALLIALAALPSLSVAARPLPPDRDPIVISAPASPRPASLQR